jgi:hypothetical protein
LPIIRHTLDGLKTSFKKIYTLEDSASFLVNDDSQNSFRALHPQLNQDVNSFLLLKLIAQIIRLYANGTAK